MGLQFQPRQPALWACPPNHRGLSPDGWHGAGIALESGAAMILIAALPWLAKPLLMNTHYLIIKGPKRLEMSVVTRQEEEEPGGTEAGREESVVVTNSAVKEP